MYPEMLGPIRKIRNSHPCLCELLIPLATNELILQDSLDAVDCICNLLDNYLKGGYRLVSFDVVSLFTSLGH